MQTQHMTPESGVQLETVTPAALQAYLQQVRWLPTGRTIRQISGAGEGNMNFTRRVTLDDGSSLILKQSVPYVARYPSIPAPADRLLSEVAFYRATAGAPAVSARMPKLLHVDPALRIAAFEDLGASQDLSWIYAGEPLTDAHCAELLGWLSALHAMSGSATSAALNAQRTVLENRAMRALNHAHMFAIPLQAALAPDADTFTPGLSVIAQTLRADAGYCARVEQLGLRYLADGEHLLHGDFYPGSWLRSPSGLKVIDAEFAFFGCAEFDAGVFMAHLLLARTPWPLLQHSMRHYRAPAQFEMGLAGGFAGVEVMRRLLGVAQLPLPLSLAQKAELLALSRTLVMPA